MHTGFVAGHNGLVPSAPSLEAQCPFEARNLKNGSGMVVGRLVGVQRTCYCRREEAAHIGAAGIDRLAWHMLIVQRIAPELGLGQLGQLSACSLPLPVAVAGPPGQAVCLRMKTSNSLVEQKVA